MPSDVVIYYEHGTEKIRDYIPDENDRSTIFYETFVDGKIYRLEYVEGTRKFFEWLKILLARRLESGRLIEYKTFNETDRGVFLYQVMRTKYSKGPAKGKYVNPDGAIFEVLGPTTVITASIEYAKGKVKITKMFLVVEGNKLKKLFDVLDRFFDYKLVKVTDASFPFRMETLSEDIKEKLTSIQMKTLKFAFESGYYTHPKRTNLEWIAKEMGVTKSTIFHHLQRAEEKIIQSVLKRFC